MTKKKDPNTLPLRVHKATQQAYVIVDGARHYLGRHGTPETQARYDKFLVEWIANGRRLAVDATDLTVVELADRFKAHVDGYYLDADGKPSNEAKHFATIFKPLRELYGRTPACEFGPLKLKAVRERFVAEGKSRRYVNSLCGRIVRMFKWSVGEELLPSSVFEALRTVPGLKRGRTTAREGIPVKPVPIEYVDAIRPYISRQVAAIIDLQLLTAARQGEIVIMRPVDIDMTGKVWTYTPTRHKSAHHGHSRLIYLGPKAQNVIRPFLNRPVEAFLFSPAEAEAERYKEQHKARKVPLSCGHVPGSNRVRKPRKAPGQRYAPMSYGKAIRYACERAWPVPAGLKPEAIKKWRKMHSWHPHQLRHNAATNLRKQFGLDVASIMLGHASCDVTQIYAEKNHEAAMRIAGKVG